MTATIIPFPQPFAYPAHWTPRHQHMFDHRVKHFGGDSARATDELEAIIHTERVVPGESADQRALRMARETFAYMKRAKR